MRNTEERKRTPFKQRTRNSLLFVLSAVTLLLLLGVGEWAVRLMFREITTTGDNKSHFARIWNREHVQLNRLGFRDRNRPGDVSRKADGFYRIAVIGDSFTFGQGIPEEDRFTDLLEQRLNGNARRYEVLNFGRPGAETVDELATLRDVVIEINPDYVLLQWFFNDVEGTWEKKQNRPKPRTLIPVSRLHDLFYRHSALYYLVNNEWRILQEKSGATETYEMYMHRRFENPDSVDSVEYRQTLKAFVGLCKEWRIPMGIVLFPELRASSFNYLYDRVANMCTEEGITCLDLRSAFASFRNRRELWVNRFDSHPNALANRLAAERLMSTFGPVWDISRR